MMKAIGSSLILFPSPHTSFSDIGIVLLEVKSGHRIGHSRTTCTDSSLLRTHTGSSLTRTCPWPSLTRTCPRPSLPRTCPRSSLPRTCPRSSIPRTCLCPSLTRPCPRSSLTRTCPCPSLTRPCPRSSLTRTGPVGPPPNEIGVEGVEGVLGPIGLLDRQRKHRTIKMTAKSTTTIIAITSFRLTIVDRIVRALRGFWSLFDPRGNRLELLQERPAGHSK